MAEYPTPDQSVTGAASHGRSGQGYSRGYPKQRQPYYNDRPRNRKPSNGNNSNNHGNGHGFSSSSNSNSNSVGGRAEAPAQAQGYNDEFRPAPTPRQENGTTYYYGAPPTQTQQYTAYGGYEDFGDYGTNQDLNEQTGQNFASSNYRYGQGQTRGQYSSGEGYRPRGSYSRPDYWRNEQVGEVGVSFPETPFGEYTSEVPSVEVETVSKLSSRPKSRSKLVLRAPPPETVKTVKVPEPSVPRESKNQRDTLVDQLTRSNYECMVCCAKLYRRQPIWSCGNCFNVFHLTCVKKWAISSAVEGSWRCPGCQNAVDTFPETYVCFCGKTKDPSPTSDLPHSCSLVCGKVKSGGPDCTHLCSLQCHPGPCPPCTDQVMRKCECGKNSAFVQCSSKTAFVCGSTCGKYLNCDQHFCSQKCHAGPCEDCAEKVILNCHCKRNKKEVPCSKECNEKKRPTYCCQNICDRMLNCKSHKCPDLCHADQCNPCPTSKDVVISCPCGQTSIAEACLIRNLPPRKSCTDPIPTCGKTCKKILTCGPQGKSHQCEKKCHTETLCPPCTKTTTVKCRCGNQENDIPCVDLLSSGDFFCAKKCTKKRSCGRHKCNTKCCIDTDHICAIVCDKPLKCGNHKCESLCHNGHCHPCPNVSFEELHCECGTAVIYPPVPCGTKPPPCIQPCRREHPCTHPVLHNCHSDPVCPPCSHLTEKWCYGKHELRKNVLCHVTNVSCGTACQKLLGCGRHKCPRICHPGQCQRPGDPCKLPCLERRKICGHTCAAPCHEGTCPDVKCKEMTEATCMCGRRKENIHCWKREIEFDRVVASAVAAGLNGLFLDKDEENSSGKSEESVESMTASIRKEKSKITVDPNNRRLLLKDRIVNTATGTSVPLKTNIPLYSMHTNPSSRHYRLDCDKECARIERNRKMAQALQLENPDVETRLGAPNYSDFCKKFAQKYPQFVELVHSKLTDVVMQVKRSKKINMTYAFDSMNRDKRTLIHEYSDHFGCLSESFDEEPNRNVIVTASKDKSWLPSVSLIDVVFRQTALKTDRKNVHQDLELVEPTKTQIIGPANRRLVSKTGSNMVFLNGS